jgi:hypothetical protein
VSSDPNSIDNDNPEDAVRITLQAFGIRPDFPVELIICSDLFHPGSIASIEYLPPPGEAIEGIALTYFPPLRRDVLAFEIGHLKLACKMLPHYSPTENLIPSAMYFGLFHDEFYDRLLLSRDFPRTSASLMALEASRLPSESQMTSDLSMAAVPRAREYYVMLPRIAQWIMDGMICSRSPFLHEFLPQFDRVLAQANATILGDFTRLVRTELQNMPSLPDGSSSFSNDAQSLIFEAVDRVQVNVFGTDTPFRKLHYSIDCRAR